MAKIVCEVKDCMHRSKRKLTKVSHRVDGSACYGCTLEYVSVVNMFDPDGDIEDKLGERVVKCADYKQCEEVE